MLKGVLKLLLVAVLALGVAVAVNTWRHGSRQLQVSAIVPPAVDGRAAGDSLSLANLADLIRFYQRLLQTSAGAPSSEGAKP